MSCVLMITMQHKIMLRAEGTPVLNRLFKPNEQYCYEGTITMLIGCGCGGATKKNIKHYLVTIDSRVFRVPETDAVESVVEILAEDQDFENKRLKTIYQDKDHSDYSGLNNNCINCNSDIAHGDYNNNIDTGGRKDPQLTGR